MALIKCPECGKEISERAVTCPNCGARVVRGCSKETNRINVIPLLILAACFTLAMIFFLKYPEIVNSIGSGADNTASDENVVQSAAQSPREQPLSFGVGDTAECQNIQITLLDVTETTGNDFYKPADGNIFVYPEFEFVNNSDEELTLSSLICFDAYQDDYSVNMSLEASIMNEGNSLDGTIPPGKKLKGAVCYEVPADYKELEIHVTLDIFSDEKVVFVYRK